jgi:hypothetical protein
MNYVYNEDNDKGEYTLQRINYAGNSAKVCPLLVLTVQ